MTTIGRVDFTVDFDGKNLPRQARAIGNRVGAQMGAATNQSFGKSLNLASKELAGAFAQFGRDLNRNTPALNRFSTGMRRLGANIAGYAYPGMVRLAQGVDRVGDSFTRARTTVGDASERIFGQVARNTRATLWGGIYRLSNGVSDLGRRLNPVLDPLRQFGERIRAQLPSTEAMAPSVRRLRNAFSDFGRVLTTTRTEADGTSRSLVNLDRSINVMSGSALKLKKSFGGGRGGNGGFFGNLDGETKLIIGIIVAAANDIAVLGSALGSGIAVLGGALAGFALGAGVIAIALQGVTGELSEIALAAQPAIAAFRGLGDEFKALQDSVQGALFANLADEIENLTVNFIPTLTTGLTGIATVLNGVFADALTRLGSNEGAAKFAEIFTGLEPVIKDLFTAVLDLVEALGNVLIVAMPYIQNFASNLGGLIKQFMDWTASLEGKNAMAEWFSNGEVILGAVSDLVGGLGKMLANLVTPDSVKRTEAFLNNFTEALPFFQKIFEVIGELDPLGLFAQILNDVGNALIPLLETLKPVASIANTLISYFVSFLGLVVSVATSFQGPLTIALTLFAELAEKLAERTTPLFDVLASMSQELSELAVTTLESLMPALESLMDAFIDLLPSPEELANIIRDQVIPWVREFSDFITLTLIPSLESAITFIDNVVTSLGGWDSIGGKLGTLATVIGTFAANVDKALAPVRVLIDAVMTALVNLGMITIKPPPIEKLTYSNGRPVGGRFANGGLVDKPMRALIGEAGPEIVVPLSRPIGQVDPSVRQLSAILQGKGFPSESGGGRYSTLNVHAGAFTLPSYNPEQTGEAVLDRLVAAAGN